MKRIAIVSAHLARGGAERVSLYLAELFTDRGYEVTLITSERYKQEYDLSPNIQREILIGDGEHYHFAKRLVVLNRRMKAVLVKKQIETVIVMGVPNCLYTVIPCVRAKIRLIVSERNDPGNFRGKKLVKILSRKLMQKADDFVFQTQDAKNYYAKTLNGRGVVIPNPLLHPDLPDPYIGEREHVIVTAGRLNEQKNQGMLIRAFARLLPEYPDYKLIIYGEGPLRETLQAQIASLGLTDSVHLPGNHPNVLSVLGKASAFVLSSDFEGMPNALIEAMAIGLPCISTDCPCGGPRELIVNGENGLLVPVSDEDSLVDAMRQLLSDPATAQKMGQKAVEIRSKLHVSKIGEDWIRIAKG